MKKRLESVLTTHRVRTALVVVVLVVLVLFSIGAGSALGVNFTQGEQTPANNEKIVTDEAISQNESTNAGLIAVSEAKSIALSRVGGGTVTESELDEDDGVKKYEIKIVWKGYEYEVDVNAQNGNILKYEKEKNDHDDDHHDD